MTVADDGCRCLSWSARSCSPDRLVAQSIGRPSSLGRRSPAPRSRFEDRSPHSVVAREVEIERVLGDHALPPFPPRSDL